MKEHLIREILLKYEKKREKAREDLIVRKNNIYENYPEIEDIDSKIFQTGLKYSKLILNGTHTHEEMVKEVIKEMTELKNIKANLLIKYKLHTDSLKEQYECKICKDKGFTSDGKKCKCLKQEIINKFYEMSNLSKTLAKENFQTFNFELFSEEKYDNEKYTPRQNILLIESKCSQYVKDFGKKNKYKENNTNKPKKNTTNKPKENNSQKNELNLSPNLLFYGTTGLGKTFMSNCIAKKLLDEGYLVIYQTAFKILEIIEDYKFKKGNNSLSVEDYNMLFECDLLIIDDLGTELTNTFSNGEIFNIVNTRILKNKPIIISTNLSPMEISKIYTDRVFSRIVANFTLLKFFGKDIRWEYSKYNLNI